MTPKAAIELLKLAKALVPGQKLDELTPDVWQAVLEDVDDADAFVALKSVAKRQTWISPSDIIAEARKIRAKRSETTELQFEYTGDPDNIPEYLRQLRTHRSSTAAGQIPSGSPAPQIDQKVLHRPSFNERLRTIFRSVPPVKEIANGTAKPLG
jgi:hypothetical protein